MIPYIFCYNYEHYKNYKPQTVNIGDYIQSIAANQFVNSSYFIDRDHLIDLPLQGYSIVNGWFYLDNYRHRFCDRTLPVSLHINNIDDLGIDKAVESLKECMPVGCRDFSTYEYLRKKKIDAYFSSCLTTTLDYKFLSNNLHRKGIIFVDVNKNIFKLNRVFPLNRSLSILRLRELIKNLLSAYNDSPIDYLYTDLPITTPVSECFDFAKSLIKKYSSAELIVTTRLHCALPCLALGTPVLLIGDNYDSLRFNGLTDFINTAIFHKNKLLIDISTDKGKIVNNNKHQPYSESLKNRCLNFVSSMKSHEIT